jgi:hypothetical protein
MPRFILKKATPLHFEGRGGRRSRPGWVAFRNPLADLTMGRASGATRHLHSSKSAKGVPNGRNPPGEKCRALSSKKQRPSILKGGVDDAVGRGGLRSEIHSQITLGAAPAAQPDTFIPRNPPKACAVGTPSEPSAECPIPGVFASLHPQKSNAPPF